SKERIEELLRDEEFTLLVTPYGTLTIHPPHKRLKFIEKYGIDPDNWVRGIDFDQDEGEQACSASLASCQGRPDRSHLRLVSEARSGEAKASALSRLSATPEPTASKEPVEQLTYAQLADRWGCSTEAARLRVARRTLPRTRGSDGKTLVAVSPQELLHQPPFARLPDGDRPVNARSPDGDRPVAESKVTSPTPPSAIQLDESAISEPPPTKRWKTKPWITNAAKQMKKDSQIPANIGISDFARKLAGRMREAAKTDSSIHRPVSWKYIKNHLSEWDLWPVAKIPRS